MHRRAQPWLGTLVQISIADDLGDAATRHACSAAFGAIAQVHGLMSFHLPSSDVARINRAPPGSAIEVHHATRTVLAMAERMRRASHGVFDIACAPLLVADKLLPRPHAAEARFAPGAAVIALEQDGTVSKLAPAWIDLGGIAKGYAVDCAIAALQRAGIGSACVNAGGDLRAFGAADFQVMVREGDGALRAVPGFRDAALATSSLYYARGASHLIDGRSGEPVLGSASVSVSAPTCMVADALTKVVFASKRVDPGLLSSYAAAVLATGAQHAADACVN